MVIKLRELSKNNSSYNLKELATEFKISVSSIRKYLKMSSEEVNDIDKIRLYKKGKTKMDDYSNIIYKMLNDNISQEYIFAYIKLKGCEASDRYLTNYINLVAKNNGYNYEDKTTFLELEYPSDVEVITRQELLKYLLTIDKKKVKNQKIEKI